MGSPITSESSSASLEAPSATPAPAAESTPAADAIQQVGSDPNQPAQVSTQSGEAVAGSQDEFPDDATFQAMPGEQRASNWQKARTRIGELNRQVGELSQLEAYKPMVEELDALGGWESVQPLLELATQLRAPLVGEDGQPVLDPSTGLPQYTAAPFVEGLARESLGTLDDILWRAIDVPYDGETLGHRLFRERFGLDPNLISLYQQIQSPEQAREFITRSGGIDPALFEGVHPQYHDVLKSLINSRPALRNVWESLEDDARSELLEDHRFLLENRKYAEEQRQRDQEAARERETAAKQRIEQAGLQAMSAADTRVRDAQLAKLKQTATFFADEADNADIWDDILSRSAGDILNNPELKPKIENWRAWNIQLAQFEAVGDRLKASQARVEISKLERKLEKEFGDRVTARTGQWSRRLGGARADHQQRIQDAKPRIEIDGVGDNSSSSPAPSYSPPPAGQRFGMSEERKRELAAQLAARRMAGG